MQIARILSAADSPLAMLVKAASRETTLGARPEGETTVVDKANDKITAAREQLLKIIGGPDPTRIAPVAPGTRLESIVDDRFAGLRALVTSPGAGQPAPITQTLALINDVYTYLATTDEALQQKTAPPPSDAPAKLRTQAARLPEPIRTALLDLGSQGAAQTQQARRVNLSADLKESISAFCTRAVGGRYPFNPGSANDVLPEDFGALFAPGGKFDDFFQKNLAQDVDVSAKPWAFKKSDSSAMQISPCRARAVRARRDHPQRLFSARAARRPRSRCSSSRSTWTRRFSPSRSTSTGKCSRTPTARRSRRRSSGPARAAPAA